MVGVKETYVKPQIHIEYFSLNQNIANCGAAHNSDWGSPSHWTKTTCGWRWPNGEVAFLNDMEVCTDKYFETDNIEGICYNNPEGGATIFGS